MNLSQLVFVNRQLAAMLKDGIPLEGALRRLVETMTSGNLQIELQLLEVDLSKGNPLVDAIKQRSLPELYIRLVTLGAVTGELPAILLLLADHYERIDNIKSRLKGILVYPLIVLIAALILSGFMALFVYPIFRLIYYDMFEGARLPPIHVWIYVPLVLTATLTMLLSCAIMIGPIRRWVAWNVPPFRDAGLARIASVFGLMLRSGASLDEAILLLARLEEGSVAGRELAKWHGGHAAGGSRVSLFAEPSRVFPGLFLWLVQAHGENLALGFDRAAEIYSIRARHRMEMILQAALPTTTLLLAGIVLVQMAVLLWPLVRTFSMLGTS